MFSPFYRYYCLSIASLGLVLGAVACTKSAPTPVPAAPPSDEVMIIAPMPVSTEFAHPMIDSARAGKIPRALLLESVFEAQALAYLESEQGKKNPDTEHLKARLEEIVEQTCEKARGAMPSKTEIDAVLEEHQGKPLAYEPKNETILDVIDGDGLMCDSGTMIHLYLQLAATTGPRFQDQNPVVLMEAGHYLPGFMIKQPVSGRYRLVGVEMTAGKKWARDYGYASELGTHPRVLQKGLRVMDASTFLAMEALGNLLESKEYSDYEMTALTRTAEKYGIPLGELEKISGKRGQESQLAAAAASQSGAARSSNRRRPGAFGDPGILTRSENLSEGDGSESLSGLPVLAGEKEVPVATDTSYSNISISDNAYFYGRGNPLQGIYEGVYMEDGLQTILIIKVGEKGEVYMPEGEWVQVGNLVQKSPGVVAIEYLPADEHFADTLALVRINPDGSFIMRKSFPEGRQSEFAMKRVEGAEGADFHYGP